MSIIKYTNTCFKSCQVSSRVCT